MTTEPKDCASPEVRLPVAGVCPTVSGAAVSAPQNPRVTQADIDCASDVLCLWDQICAVDEGAQIVARHREAAEAASKAREAALVEALGRAELRSWSLQQCDITFTFADANDLRIVRDTASAARAALTKEPDA